MDKTTYYKWYQENILQLYPDIADQPGKRVLIKSDGGPGRSDAAYLSEANFEGLLHYPGLPNGTLFQEMDQAFANLKTKMEGNRKKNFNKMFDIYKSKAKVSCNDIGYILFGHDKNFVNGTTMTLDSPFGQ